MKILRALLVIAAAAGLVGCSQLGLPQPSGADASQSAQTATAASILLPSDTPAVTSDAFLTPAPGKITATPAPEVTATAAPALLPEGLSAPSFRDCALAPGWVGCDASRPAIPARVALYDRVRGGVAALDLETKGGWQMAARPESLSWSPAGDRLLLGQLSAAGTLQYQVYGPDLTPEETIPAAQEALRWQPNNQIGSGSKVFSPKGDEARLEYTSDGHWLLHVIPAGGQERIMPIDVQPSDRLYTLVAWVPGTEAILAQTYFASNAAAMFGGQLLTLNAQNGDQHPLEPLAPLDERAAFRWSPVSPTLAFIATGSGESETGRRLALIDFTTGQVQYPLAEGVQVSDLAWSPDGSALVFSAAPAPALSPEAQAIFSGPGIYQYNLSGQPPVLIVPTPAGAVDGFVQWVKDGTLLYARAQVAQSGDTTIDLHARKPAAGEDWLLVQGLPGPQLIDGQVPWERVLAYGAK